MAQERRDNIDQALLKHIRRRTLATFAPGRSDLERVLHAEMVRWQQTNENELASIQRLHAYGIPVRISASAFRSGNAAVRDYAVDARTMLDNFIKDFLKIDYDMWLKCNPPEYAATRKEIYTGLPNEPAGTPIRSTPRFSSPSKR